MKGSKKVKDREGINQDNTKMVGLGPTNTQDALSRIQTKISRKYLDKARPGKINTDSTSSTVRASKGGNSSTGTSTTTSKIIKQNSSQGTVRTTKDDNKERGTVRYQKRKITGCTNTYTNNRANIDGNNKAVKCIVVGKSEYLQNKGDSRNRKPSSKEAILRKTRRNQVWEQVGNLRGNGVGNPRLLFRKYGTKNTRSHLGQ